MGSVTGGCCGSQKQVPAGAVARPLEQEPLPTSTAEVPRGPPNYAAVGYYAVLGLGFAAMLTKTLIQYPLIPVQSDNAEWASNWLLVTVLDYYTVSPCVCGVILATEGLAAGLPWCLLQLLLGAPFACAYMIYHLRRGGLLALASVPSPSGGNKFVLMGLYAVLGALFAARLGWTLYKYPLIPLQVDNAEWSFEWLLSTIGDYYTNSACLIGVTLATESAGSAAAWTLAQLTLGGPVNCAYVIFCLLSHGTLKLASRASPGE